MVKMGRPALSPEARQNQMIALAENLAEKQLREGTASSQVITHYLKLGTIREQKELEILEMQKELVKAKTESLQTTKDSKELLERAMRAFTNYSGQGDPDEY